MSTTATTVADATYKHFVNGVNTQAQSVLDAQNSIVWSVDVAGEAIYEAYLSGFDTVEMRKEHTCNCCKSFLVRLGSLVYVDDGEYKSVLWSMNIKSVPDVYRKSVLNLKQFVEASAKINAKHAYVAAEAFVGENNKGGFDHFVVNFKHPRRDAHQQMAQRDTNYAMLKRALGEYTIEVAQEALSLLGHGSSLYRADHYYPLIKWFVEVIKIKNEAKLVKHAASAPLGYCAIRNSPVGELMSMINDKIDFNSVRARWMTILDPAHFQRAQTPPAAGNIASATALIKQLGLEASLVRKYAGMADIPKSIVLWESQKVVSAPVAKSARPVAAGPFDNLTPKAKSGNQATASLGSGTGMVTGRPPATMSWAKFTRVVLPTAKRIEIQEKPTRLVALMTSQDADAAPIVVWDLGAKRNPVSWSYMNGADGEFKRRVQRQDRGRDERVLVMQKQRGRRQGPEREARPSRLASTRGRRQGPEREARPPRLA